MLCAQAVFGDMGDLPPVDSVLPLQATAREVRTEALEEEAKFRKALKVEKEKRFGEWRQKLDIWLDKCDRRYESTMTKLRELRSKALQAEQEESLSQSSNAAPEEGDLDDLQRSWLRQQNQNEESPVAIANREIEDFRVWRRNHKAQTRERLINEELARMNAWEMQQLVQQGYEKPTPIPLTWEEAEALFKRREAHQSAPPNDDAGSSSTRRRTS